MRISQRKGGGPSASLDDVQLCVMQITWEVCFSVCYQSESDICLGCLNYQGKSYK